MSQIPPPWFQAWDQNSFQPFVAKVDTLVAKVDTLTARMQNRGHRATDHQDPFVIIPCRDGSDPTSAHGLPALRDPNDIRQLTEAQSTQYCINYGIVEPGDLANRRRLIAIHIGYHHEL